MRRSESEASRSRCGPIALARNMALPTNGEPVPMKLRITEIFLRDDDEPVTAPSLRGPEGLSSHCLRLTEPSLFAGGGTHELENRGCR
jgi:hypothetical protein